MNVVNIERDFTSWVADKMGLKLDTEIFRGGIPEKIKTGAAVLFGSEMPSTGFYGFRPRAWNAQILAKFDDRDEAMVFLAKVSGLFPVGNFTHGETKFLALEPISISEPYSAADRGKKKWYVSFNLVVSVLTVGAQSMKL